VGSVSSPSTLGGSLDANVGDFALCGVKHLLLRLAVGLEVLKQVQNVFTGLLRESTVVMVNVLAHGVSTRTTSVPSEGNNVLLLKNTLDIFNSLQKVHAAASTGSIVGVLEKKDIIPFRRYTGGPGRHAMCKNVHHHNGRFPEKSCKHVLNLLKNLKANCESEKKMLDPAKCKITHVCVQRATKGRRRTYRAHGRISPYLSSNCHVEFHVTEQSEQVAREDKQEVKLTKKQAARQRLAIGK
jgi:large subunit ribosomal protein L17e